MVRVGMQMSSKIKILEMPLYHVDYILKLIQFSTENPSLSRKQIELLREIEEHIIRQIDKT